MSYADYNDEGREAETTTLTLYYIRDTARACLYCTKAYENLGRNVWVPKSLIERRLMHKALAGELARHEVELPDWFVQREAL